MNTSYLIKKEIDKIGREAYLLDGEWRSMPFKMRLDFLWRKKTSTFEPEHTQLGKVDAEYYLYIGPKSHNILELSDNAILVSGNDSYVFNRRDAVTISGEVIYYSGIVSRVKGDDYDEYDGIC